MDPGYFWLFCSFDVIRWLAWRRSTEQQDLLVEKGFVAVNSELYDNFELWKSQHLPWSDEDDTKAWVPYNQTVEMWWSVSHDEPAQLKAAYSCRFILLTVDEMKGLLAFV